MRRILTGGVNTFEIHAIENMVHDSSPIGEIKGHRKLIILKHVEDYPLCVERSRHEVESMIIQK